MSKDHVLWTLFGGTLFMVALLLVAAWFLPANKELFAVYSSLLSGFAGALFMYIRGNRPSDPKDPQ